MATSTRDRVTVDLQGLRPRLIGVARERRRSPSDLVRQYVAEGLGHADDDGNLLLSLHEVASTARARICLRMPADDCAALKRAASAATLDPGRFVAMLVAGADRAGLGPDRHALLAALRESNAELSQLSRSLRHLTALLSAGAVRAAQEYRQMLDGVERDVRQHLSVAAEALQRVDAHRRGPGGWPITPCRSHG